MRGADPLPARTLRQNRQGRDSGAAPPRYQSTTLADRLPGRRFSLLVVSQVLAISLAFHHVELRPDMSGCKTHVQEKKRSLDSARNDKRAKVTCAGRELNSLPCSSSDNRIRSQPAADCFVEKVPAASADN